MLFTRKVTPINHPDLFLHNVKIKNYTKHKHLGIFLKSDCRWTEHIRYVETKVKFKLLILRKLKYLLDRKTLEQIYFSYIRPIMEYGNLLWTNYTDELENDLEKLQLEAMRIITGAVKGTHHRLLYNESKWHTLSERRRNSQIILMKKMINNEVPTFLSNLLPPPKHQPYTLRNYGLLFEPMFARTNLFLNSFVPNTIRLWNDLDKETKQIESTTSLKAKLCKREKAPLYYNLGTRKGMILHARLRMNCSDLNHHLYLRHLQEDQTCQCGHPVEDTEHFLKNCPLYNEARELYLPVDIPTNILLYGNDELNYDGNKDIFESVNKFIIHSERFR